MATNTTHYNLKKPAGTEDINVNDINTNMDKIDTELFNTPRFRGNLTSGNDMNNLTGDGYWRIEGSVPGNCPSGYTWCFVFQFVVGTVTQQYIIKPSNMGILIREYTGSPQVWSSWKIVSGIVGKTRIDYGSNSYVEYWKNGIVAQVFVKYSVSDGSINSWTTKNLATIPEGFRPIQSVEVRGVMDRAGDDGAYATVNSNGVVAVNTRYNAFSTSGGAMQANIIFPVML